MDDSKWEEANKIDRNVISFIGSYTLAKFELWPTIAIRSRHA